MTDTAEPVSCPDKGFCHHGCDTQSRCWRVLNAEPLSAARYPDDRWPGEIVQARLAAEPGRPPAIAGAASPSGEIPPPLPGEEDAPEGAWTAAGQGRMMNVGPAYVRPEGLSWDALQPQRPFTAVMPVSELGELLARKREEVRPFISGIRDGEPSVADGLRAAMRHAADPGTIRDALRLPEGAERGRDTGPLPADMDARTDSFMALSEPLSDAGEHARPRRRRIWPRPRTSAEQLDRPSRPHWQALWRPLAFLALHWSRLCGKCLPGWQDARIAAMRRRFERMARKNPAPPPVAVIRFRPDAAPLQEGITRVQRAIAEEATRQYRPGRHAGGDADRPYRDA